MFKSLPNVGETKLLAVLIYHDNLFVDLFTSHTQEQGSYVARNLPDQDWAKLSKFDKTDEVKNP